MPLTEPGAGQFSGLAEQRVPVSLLSIASSVLGMQTLTPLLCLVFFI